MRPTCASPCGILARLVFLAIEATAPVAAQSVFVVDSSDGGDFVSLQDAVNAAVTGGCREGVRLEAEAGESEGLQGLDDAPAVLLRRTDEEVQVLGEPRVAMEGHGVPADDEELNVPGGQRPDTLFQIGLQVHRAPRGSA